MTVEAVVFSPEGVTRHDVESPDGLAAARTATGTTWVRAVAPDDDELSRVADAYDIHRLEVEDVTGDVRPKVELGENHTFLLARSARLRSGETTFEEEIRDPSVGLFIGEDWLVSISTTALDPIETVWERVLGAEQRLLKRGPDFAAYRVVDRLVDEYFGVLDAIERDIEHVEEGVTAEPNPDTLEQINGLRRELLSIRRIAWPMRDALGRLSRGDAVHVQDATERYYRDAYDHVVQLVELIETYRDLAGGARDIYLNTVSQSTNEVMKQLTVVATIVLPLTFVVGVYGMNFADSPYNMPELEWAFGYPAVLLGMLGIALVMLSYFRRQGWL